VEQRIKKKNILALDTATPVFSAALAFEGEKWYFEADAGNRHSEIIMDAVDWLLKKARAKPEDLSIVACMKGPGSFTGLRIGYSAAKGLCLPFHAALSAVPTLECMGMAYADWDGVVLPIIDAKKRAFFAALFQKGKRLCEDLDASPEYIAECIEKLAQDAPLLLAGPDAPLLSPALERFRPRLSANFRQGYAKTLLDLAPLFIEKNKFCGPEYIRKSDAEIEFGSNFSASGCFLCGG
jgi:tRNA threonylcarbamoyladenosine biosynthesis protein TsaB